MPSPPGSPTSSASRRRCLRRLAYRHVSSPPLITISPHTSAAAVAVAERQHRLFANLIPLLKRDMGGGWLRDDMYITHDDMHRGNVLLDASIGTVLAVLDWEQQAGLPAGFGAVVPTLAQSTI